MSRFKLWLPVLIVFLLDVLAAITLYQEIKNGFTLGQSVSFTFAAVMFNLTIIISWILGYLYKETRFQQSNLY